jgi:hypothetical protein
VRLQNKKREIIMTSFYLREHPPGDRRDCTGSINPKFDDRQQL